MLGTPQQPHSFRQSLIPKYSVCPNTALLLYMYAMPKILGTPQQYLTTAVQQQYKLILRSRIVRYRVPKYLYCEVLVLHYSV